ncbi:MAG: hypothetical protein ACXW04_12405 [Methylobacter sp.]
MTSISKFTSYEPFIKNLPKLESKSKPMKELLLWENKKMELECYYAPFDYINRDAKIILVGITPGATKMNNSINSARELILRGENPINSMKKTKINGSFSGKMRPLAKNILNKTGYHKMLGISCCSELWTKHNNLVHFCSLLKYPVFFKGGNYNGKPDPFKVSELKEMLYDEFINDLALINKDAMLVPFGDFVANVIAELKDQNLISQRITTNKNGVVSLPHPSGENNESISLLLKDKYPQLNEYQDYKYREYVADKIKTGDIPQNETTYKKTRATRWESMLLVSNAYSIN